MYSLDNGDFLPRRGQGVQVLAQINRPEDWFNALPPVFGMEPYADLVAARRIARPDGPRSSVGRFIFPTSWRTASINRLKGRG